MSGGLFALPCPACGAAMEIAELQTAYCIACDQSYLARFGHLIAISRTEASKRVTA